LHDTEPFLTNGLILQYNTIEYNLYIVAEVVYKTDHWRTWKRKREWHAGFKSDQLVTMVKWYTEQQTPLPL